MKNKDLYFIIPLSIAMIVSGLYLLLGKEIFFRVPLKTWAMGIAFYIGFFYSLIIGIEIKNKTLKFLFGAVQLFLLALLATASYSIFKTLS